ncbi:MAG: hypothetical protein KIG68_05635 [Oxalobacter sp.]|nr:hypothetical protein [Oxalobacter sp.]
MAVIDFPVDAVCDTVCDSRDYLCPNLSHHAACADAVHIDINRHHVVVTGFLPVFCSGRADSQAKHQR